MSTRRLFLLIAVSLGLWLVWPSTAHAQNVQQCAYPAGGWASCDEGKAFVECKAALSRAQAIIATSGSGQVIDACAKVMQSTMIVYKCSYKGYAAGAANPCPGHSSQTSAAPIAAACSARPPEMGWKSQPGGGSQVCHNGCAYSSSLDAGSANGFAYDPTGATCTPDEMPEPEPSEGGGGDDGGGGGQIPGDGDGGGDAGGGDSGGGGDGNGGGGGGEGGDGGDGGDGGGDGGDGGGLPGGDGDGDGNEPGQPAPTEGDLYTKSDKTIQGVVSKFHGEVMKLPIGKGISNFMRVPGGGACPVFTLGASTWWRSMSIDFHCSGAFLSLLRACGFVILAIAAYAAARIALT